MLSDKNIKMLKILDKRIENCSKCNLCSNGCAIPLWSPNSRFAIIAEAPGITEIRQKTPFVGAAGNILTRELSNIGFKASDFLIINTVQCRPVYGNRNGKPTESQIISCQDYLRKYIKIVNPEKILCLGNYSKYIFTGNTYGILRERGKWNNFKLEGSEISYPTLFTVHPAYCIYNLEEGLPMLKEDIKLFKKTEFHRRSDWFLTEEDFKI